MNEHAVKFVSLIIRLTDNVYALNIAHVELIEDVANSRFVNVAVDAGNT